MFTRLLLSACLMFMPIFSPATSFRKVAAKDLRYSVLLRIKGEAKDAKGKVHQVYVGCSGTYISKHEILTADHCFEDYKPTKMWARGPDDLVGYPVILVRQDRTRDLAIVTAFEAHAYAKLGEVGEPGDPVLSVGSPLAFEFVTTTGSIALTYLAAPGFSGTYIVHTSMVDHGSSGGGLFDIHGRLIGVNTIKIGLFEWGGLSMAVDADTIREFLKGKGK